MDDVVDEYGLTKLSDVEYHGNFTIKFWSRDELIALRNFFKVRRNKFDMKLLETREDIKERLFLNENIDCWNFEYK